MAVELSLFLTQSLSYLLQDPMRRRMYFSPLGCHIVGFCQEMVRMGWILKTAYGSKGHIHTVALGTEVLFQFVNREKYVYIKTRHTNTHTRRKKQHEE